MTMSVSDSAITVLIYCLGVIFYWHIVKNNHYMATNKR